MSTTHQPPVRPSVRPPDLGPEARAALTTDRTGSGPAGGGHHHRRMGETPALIALALILAFLIKTFVVQAFYIPSGSMIPTLEIGDRVLVEKLTYRVREPQRGEVIVFRRPGAEVRTGPRAAVRSFFEGLGLVQPDQDIDLIKRIVGLPGETVELRKGRVHINGQPLDEPYAALDVDDYGPVTVPDGELLMLGDNRGNSDDSRRSLGTVPVANIVGRAWVILWPPMSFDLGLDQDYAGVGETPLPGATPVPSQAPTTGPTDAPATAPAEAAVPAPSEDPAR